MRRSGHGFCIVWKVRPRLAVASEAIVRLGYRFLAWFNAHGGQVTLYGVVVLTILARSASEGSTYPRLRFGLVSRKCYPTLNPAEKKCPVKWNSLAFLISPS